MKLKANTKKQKNFSNNALDIQKNVLGEKHPSYATTLNNLGLIYNAQGKYKETEEFFNNALDIEKNVLGKKHPVMLPLSII